MLVPAARRSPGAATSRTASRRRTASRGAGTACGGGRDRTRTAAATAAPDSRSSAGSAGGGGRDQGDGGRPEAPGYAIGDGVPALRPPLRGRVPAHHGGQVAAQTAGEHGPAEPGRHEQRQRHRQRRPADRGGPGGERDGVDQAGESQQLADVGAAVEPLGDQGSREMRGRDAGGQEARRPRAGRSRGGEQDEADDGAGVRGSGQRRPGDVSRKGSHRARFAATTDMRRWGRLGAQWPGAGTRDHQRRGSRPGRRCRRRVQGRPCRHSPPPDRRGRPRRQRAGDPPGARRAERGGRERPERRHLDRDGAGRGGLHGPATGRGCWATGPSTAWRSCCATWRQRAGCSATPLPPGVTRSGCAGCRSRSRTTRAARPARAAAWADALRAGEQLAGLAGGRSVRCAASRDARRRREGPCADGRSCRRPRRDRARARGRRCAGSPWPSSGSCAERRSRPRPRGVPGALVPAARRCVDDGAGRLVAGDRPHLARPLVRAGVGPWPVTAAGVVLAGSACWPASAGSRWPLLAALLVAASGVLDNLDGAVAVLSGRTSRWGFVLDSSCDRLADAAYCVALLLAGAPAWAAVAGGGTGLAARVRAGAGSRRGHAGGRRRDRLGTPHPGDRDGDVPARRRAVPRRRPPLGRRRGGRLDGARRRRPGPAAPRGAPAAHGG